MPSSLATRCVESEVLDGLPADDPRAERSRRDLRRVHWVMRSVSTLRRAVADLGLPTPPKTILELGAGDGTLLLRFARSLRPHWQEVELTLLDRIDIVSPATRAAYQALGWRLRVLRADALAWAAAPPRQHYDLSFANLFLHHFEGAALDSVLRTVAAASDAFVACEPRRSRAAHAGSRSIMLLGANAVTREDAVKSVSAGFAGSELTAAWQPHGGEWRVAEFAAWPFAHCFTAVRVPDGVSLGGARAS
jgi:hypothetical protein